jgi:hypothetical protein
VVFARLRTRADRPAPARPASPEPAPGDGEATPLVRLWRAAWNTPDEVNPFEFWGRAALWLGLVVLGWSYLSAPIQRSQMAPSFVHFLVGRVNLVFHEAGHVVFGMLGRFVATLGGSLLQVLVPLICAASFLLRYGNAFAASAALWWAGQSLIDLAPYIDDARAQQMILLGGVTGRDAPGYHDWHYLLWSLNSLDSDHALARLAHFTGAVWIALALLWGGRLLVRQYQALGRGVGPGGA